MSSEPFRPAESEIAHVLFMDLVEFSRLPMQDQTRLISRLQELLRANPDFQRAEANHDLIRLPTGDGIALVFFRDPEAPVRCGLDVARAARGFPQMKLRIGIHSGPVHRLADINANANVAGSGINLAQRVMDAGDSGHILLSNSIVLILHQVGGWSEYLRDLGEYDVKHGQRLHLYNLYRDGAGNRNRPTRLRTAAVPVRAAGVKVALLYKRNVEQDEQLVRLIEERLVAKGYDVFIDRHLTIGVDWSREIEGAIRRADAVIPLLSEASIQSDTITFELEKAVEAAREHQGRPRLLPVRIKYEGKLPPALAGHLDAVEYTLWQGPEDDERLVADLLDGLAKVQAESTAAMPEPAPPTGTPRRRSPVAWLAAATMAVALLVFWLGERQGWLSFGGIALGTKQLAVLPFTHIGGAAGNDALSDGLSETITSQLTQLEQFQTSLLVVPMAEVRKEAIGTPSQARTVFGVTVALTGSVQREASNVRVNVSLVDTKTLRILRSATLDSAPTEFYRLQDRVAAQAAEWLGLKVPAEARRALASGRTTAGPAYELYLRGVGELARRDLAGNLETAIVHLQQALVSDPRYALAHAALSEAFWRKYEENKDTQWLEEARQSCNTALKLDPLLPSAHATLALIMTGAGQYEQAVAESQEALRLDPLNAEATRSLARAYGRLTRPAEAEAAYQRAIDRHPGNWLYHTELAGFYYRNGRHADAEKYFLKVTALTPDNPGVYRNLGGLYIEMGRYDDAATVLGKSLALKPTPAAHSNLGTLRFLQHRYAESARLFELAVAVKPGDFVLLGNLADALRYLSARAGEAPVLYEKAIRLAEGALAVNSKDAGARASLALYHAFSGESAQAMTEIEAALRQAPASPPILFNAALVYERAGQRDRALAALGTAMAGGYTRSEAENHPDLESLRKDVRFAPLWARLSAEKLSRP